MGVIRIGEKMNFRVFGKLAANVGFLLAIIAVCGSSQMLWAQNNIEQEKIERVMPKEEFIDLFRKKYTSDAESSGVQKRFADAAAFIEICCSTPEKISALLQDNGFEVSIHKHADPNTIRVAHPRSKKSVYEISYDQLISGTRAPGWRRFWQITTTYRASIYLNEGKVVFVAAVVDTAMP